MQAARTGAADVASMRAAPLARRLLSIGMTPFVIIAVAVAGTVGYGVWLYRKLRALARAERSRPPSA